MAEMQFKSNGRFTDRDAAIIGPELMRIARRHDNALTPSLVVAEATDAGSKLHRYFEWNNDVAAVEYRLEQARRMCRSIDIVVEAGPQRVVRGFVNVTADAPAAIDDLVIAEERVPSTPRRPERTYVPIDVARRDERIWKDVLDEAERRIFLWKEKYETLLEYGEARERLAGVMREIDALRQAAGSSTGGRQ